jgi:hypothetical protein
MGVQPNVYRLLYGTVKLRVSSKEKLNTFRGFKCKWSRGICGANRREVAGE